MIQNVRLLKPNMTRVAGYFYSMDETTDSLIQKTDDGTFAFSYPLDTPISNQVKSLEHDGESFWSLAWINDGNSSAGFRIRRWLIQNFVLVLQQTFTYASGATDTFDCQSMTIERYSSTLAAGASSGATSIYVNYDATRYALITPGVHLYLGPNGSGAYERVTISSPGPSGNQLQLTAPLTNSYLSSQAVTFSKNIWFFSNNYLLQVGVGGLYKASVLDGSILSRTQGGAYTSVDACGFTTVSSFTGALAVHNKPFLIFIRTTNLLFIDVSNSNLVTELSALQNNINAATTTVYNVYDLGIEGNTIYRLQLLFTINAVDSSESTYNYQLATFKPFPTAIALTAVEAILPASSGAATSAITATVTDQYLLPFIHSGSTLTYTIAGGGTGSSISPATAILLDSLGQAHATYTTGSAAGLVTITATVTI